MMRSTFSLVDSMPDSSRISSSTLSDRFCASSTISSTLRPAAYCSMRKLLTVAISSAFFILKGEKPNCTSTDCRNSTAVTWVWLTWATTTSESSCRRKLSISVVLPEPISPVMTTNPSANQMVDSMYAFARACARDRNRNCGSGLSRNGGSRSLNISEYMPRRYYGKAGGGSWKPLSTPPKCDPGRAIHASQHLQASPVAGPGGSLDQGDVP